MLQHIASCDVLPQPFIIISPVNPSDMQQFLMQSEISHLHFLGRGSINEQGSEKSATIDCYRSDCKAENTLCTCNNNQQRQQQLTASEQEDLQRESPQCECFLDIHTISVFVCDIDVTFAGQLV